MRFCADATSSTNQVKGCDEHAEQRGSGGLRMPGQVEQWTNACMGGDCAALMRLRRAGSKGERQAAAQQGTDEGSKISRDELIGEI